MKKTLILLSGAILALLATSCGAPKDNVLTRAEQKDGWKLLFDGTTLDGWHCFGGAEIGDAWTTEEGCILAEGNGGEGTGYLLTDAEYENFELVWDWKIEKGGNSGLLYHVVEPSEFSVPYTGPEYQLIDDDNYNEIHNYDLQDWQRCAVDYAMYLPDFETRKLNPAGEWNSSKVVFDNGHVTYYLNGQVSVEFDAWTPDWFARKNSGKWSHAPEYGMARSGRICFQDHGCKAWFKNVKVRELPRKPQEVELFNGKDLTGWVVYGTDPWYVEDGTLVCESGTDGTYGYLGTDKYYDDFDLTLEFKQESEGNSGVFVRSTVPHDVTVNGWQVEVAPQGCDTGGVYESYGRGWLYQIPDEKENILKYGEWNIMRIRLKGDHIQTWLNGEPMTDLTDEKIGAGKGRICLQIHDGGGIKVRWRNLKLQEL